MCRKCDVCLDPIYELTCFVLLPRSYVPTIQQGMGQKGANRDFGALQRGLHVTLGAAQVS